MEGIVTRKRNRLQTGSICAIGSNWFVRYSEVRNIGGTLQRKKVSHRLGPITTRGKHPPADVVAAAREHMASVTGSKLPATRVLTLADFVEQVFLPTVKQQRRQNTHTSYAALWKLHIAPHAKDEHGREIWLKNTRTYDVQRWLDAIALDRVPDGSARLSINSLRRVKSVLSAIFSTAARLDYYHGANPVQSTRVDPAAPPPAATYAYTLEEINALLALLPEPAATAFAVASFSGLRLGEIEGLRWSDYHDGELRVARAIVQGRVGAPKTSSSSAAVPVIRQLADRLEMHRLRSKTISPDGEQFSGPIFANSLGHPLSLRNVLTRHILPVLNLCGMCGQPKKNLNHVAAPSYEGEHVYQRDPRIPQWRGWHACRRGLGSNLYRLGVPAKLIQAILRHSNVATTQSYYILSTADDVRNAMKTLELAVPEIETGHLRDTKPEPGRLPETIN
jgi:integrase